MGENLSTEHNTTLPNELEPALMTPGKITAIQTWIDC